MKISRPPGPKPNFLIGNVVMFGSSPLTKFRQWAAEYGDIFYYRAGWMHVYYLNHPDLIEYVLIRNPQNFVKAHILRKVRWVLGEGLLTGDGDHWRRQRRLCQPGFTQERILGYSRCMTVCAGEMLAGWSPGTVVNIQEEMMGLALRIVMRALFDLESAETKKISSAFNTIFQTLSGPRLIIPGSLRYLIPGMRRINRLVAQLNTMIYGIIHQRRQNMQEHSGSLLSFLMAARDEDGSQMTDEDLRDEIMTFLVAGYETTGLALTWALHLLAKDKSAEDKLHDEVDRVLGGRIPTMSDIRDLRFTESIIKESLRLYPPVWSMNRIALQDFELGGYTIPRNAVVTFSQWVMHHHPKYFSDPDKFDPERWLQSTTEKLPKLAYFPFGGGYRQCIGGSFAMTEAVLLLAMIAQQFQLSSAADPPVVPLPSLTLRPKYGSFMRIERRESKLNVAVAQQN